MTDNPLLESGNFSYYFFDSYFTKASIVVICFKIWNENTGAAAAVKVSFSGIYRSFSPVGEEQKEKKHPF